YGKKPSWKVEVDSAVITNRTSPDTKPLAQEEPTLPWGRTLVVETARDGFDAEVIRHVIAPDGSKPRELDLKSTYQPAHTVTLVGTAGKPASANVDDAIQHALDALKPAEAKPSPTPGPAAANGTPAAAATVGPTPMPKPAATPAPTNAAPAPTAAKPQAAQPTPKPTAQSTQNRGIAP